MTITSRRRGLARVACAALIAAAAAGPSLAGDASPADHSQHQAAGKAGGEELSEASKAYEAVLQKMHKDMSLGYTNDVDEDFVRGMIPHNKGAIEQAEVLLKYSKNPRLRRLAGGIIAAQRREIYFMQHWLEAHGKGVETGEMPDWLKTAPSTVEDARKAGGQ